MENITFSERELENDRRLTGATEQMKYLGRVQKIILSINFWIGSISVTVIALMAASFFWTVSEFSDLRLEFSDLREEMNARFEETRIDIALIKEKLGI